MRRRDALHVGTGDSVPPLFCVDLSNVLLYSLVQVSTITLSAVCVIFVDVYAMMSSVTSGEGPLQN